MKLAYRYLLNHFLSTNLSLFVVLFLIVSMVFFIQLARMTASIEISLIDFFKLYSFMIPRILIFTLPLSFFIALTLTLFRLSRENESIVYFTLGFSPRLMANFFLKVAFLFSAFMLVISLIFIPVAYALQSNFIDFKKTQAKLNIKTGEFGQKILDWLIFVESEDNGLYKNIIMYHPLNTDTPLTTNKEQFITAQSARLSLDEQSLSFTLYNGSAYNFEQNNTWFVTHFDDIKFNFFLLGLDERNKNFYEYWSGINSNEKRAKEFVIYALISLFPLATTLFALSFGLVTYRYEKGFAYLGIFAVIALYFGALSVFYQPPLIAVGVIFASFFVLSFVYFGRKILRRY